MAPSPEAEEPAPEGGEEEEAEALMESLEAAGVFLDEDADWDMGLEEGDFMDEDYLEEEMPMDDDWEGDGMDADLGPVGMELDEEELVNEVTRRVGRRLAQRIGRKR